MIVCITNSLSDMRPCVLEGEHWDDLVPPELDQTRRRHLLECAGCIPRPADVGFVCQSCFTRVDEAAREVYPFFQQLDGIERAIQAEAASRGKPGSQIPITSIGLSLDEVARFYRSSAGAPAERWVASRTGAADAVRFARAFRRARKQHPIAETSHQVRITRCPRCEHRSLVWTPPQHFLGHVTVACSYASTPEKEGEQGTPCGFEADQTSFERIADLEQQNPSRNRLGEPLVFARSYQQAREWAREQGWRPRDWTYVGSAHGIRGVNTVGRPRHFLPGFEDRRDAAAILEHLRLADASDRARSAA